MKTLSLIAALTCCIACHRAVPLPDRECPAPIRPTAPVQLDTPEEDAPDEASAWAYVPGWESPGSGGAIKQWDTRERLTSSDLNSNFTHIHTNMVGGHGGRLVDSDVNASASIATSKLAGYRFIPVAWTVVSPICAAGTCALTVNMGVTSIVWNATGVYVGTIPARTDANYAVFTTVSGCTAGACVCTGGAISATTFGVGCYRTDTGGLAAVNGSFQIAIMDNN